MVLVEIGVRLSFMSAITEDKVAAEANKFPPVKIGCTYSSAIAIPTKPVVTGTSGIPTGNRAAGIPAPQIPPAVTIPAAEISVIQAKLSNPVAMVFQSSALPGMYLLVKFSTCAASVLIRACAKVIQL